MGQEQSVPAPRRMPNKLSKPKTNSTLNLLSRSALHLDRKDAPYKDIPGHGNRYSVIFADPEVRQEAVEEVKVKKETKRRSIFRSLSTPAKEPVPARFEDEFDPEEEKPKWSLQQRANFSSEDVFSQFQEEKTRPPNRSRMSLQHIPISQSQQRLSLVAEVPTPAEESPNRLSTYGELRSPQLSNPLYARTNSDVDLYGPMRRRSFLQHGVATRPVFATSDSRHSLPSQVRPQEHYNFLKPSAYLASLKQGDMPRVETPDDLGYRHTGAYNLGTLRITNGVASPTPSIERIERAATMGAGEDYISAGNLRRITEGHRRGASSRSNTMSIPGERLKSPWIVHEESPLRKAARISEILPNSPTLPDLDTSLSKFDFDSTFQSFSQVQSPTRSQDLADEYMQEIAMSPYSFVPSRTPSPRLEATSKHTAMEDELFEAEPLTPSLSHVPSSADSGYGGTSRASSAPRQKPLAKADSGYSSNISLRSFKVSSQPPPVPAKDGPVTPPRESRVASSTYSYASKETITKHSLPTLRTVQTSKESKMLKKDTPPTTPVKPKEQTFATYKIQEVKAQQLRGLIDPLRSHPSSKTKQHKRTGSEPKSHGISKLVSNKKEKARPYSVQPENTPYTVQAQRHELINVPPVSFEISRRLEDRVDAFTVVSFPNMSQRLHRTESKETLGTIFSVGSGFTEIPRGQEITKSRLQEELPAPPAARRGSINTSNSYYPPKTPPRKLQKRSSIGQEMAAYEEVDVTLSRRVSYQDMEAEEALTVTKRSQSMTSEQPVSRNVSAESTTTLSTLLSRKSYDSIAGRPFGSRTSSYEHLVEPKSAPLQTPKLLSVDQDPVQRRLSWGNRDKKQPPVSMQTQRKVTPIPQATYKLFPTPPRRPPPTPLTPVAKDPPKMAPLQPARAAPPPPVKILPSPLISHPLSAPLPPHQDSPRPEVDLWAEQKIFWAERRNSADTLQSQRPALSNRNSSSTQGRGVRRPPSVHQNSNLKIQKSMEAVRARMFQEQKMYMPSTPNLRDSGDFEDHRGSIEELRRRQSREEDARQKRERDKAGEMLAGWTSTPNGTTPGEYHHTYGYQLPITTPQHEYFSQPEEAEFNHYRDFHKRQSSTADMLTLDRFSGGLDYGVELNGSAGMRTGRGERKSLAVSRTFGLDLSDVPVFLQRIPGVEGAREV